MNTFVLVAASLLAVAACAPYYGDEIILKGPSGVITPHGPIGTSGPVHGSDDYHYEHDDHQYEHDDHDYASDDHHYGNDGEDDGQYHGEHYDEGHYDDGQYHGEQHGQGHYDDGQYHDEGVSYHHNAPAVALIAPSAYYYAVPAHHEPLHENVAYGNHGVAVKGPHTVSAVLAGPSGKVVAHGLYGASSHHSYHHY